MKAAVISERGMRTSMEDAHFLDTDFGGRGWVFAGVYDGHGGSLAAEYAAKRLHRVFLDAVLAGIAPPDAFVQSYEMVSRELATQDSGATAVNFFIRDGVLYAANAGDARAIVVSRETVRQVTVDHRLDNPEERRRIELAGGRIEYPYAFRGNAGLMPTRTLGDEYFKLVGIIATPSVSEYRLTLNDLVVLAACDGLFDFIGNEQAADFVRRFPEPGTLLEELKREVLFQRGGSDNLTIIAVSQPDAD